MKPTLLLLLLPLLARAQANDGLIRQKVLQLGIVDSEFICGKWTSNGGTETHLTYLGEINTKSGRNFKVMNSVWLWGHSRRATNRILLFDHQDRYIGEYYVTTTPDLPSHLTKGKLIFTNNKKDNCNRRLTTIVNLNNGIPRQFFLKCNGTLGDIYTFSSE